MRLLSVSLLASALLALTACGGGGGGSGSSSSSSSSGGSSNPPVTITLFSDAALVGSGQSPTLRWNSSGTACTAGGGWSGSKATAGSEVVGPLTQTTNFTLSCTATNAATANAALTVVTSTALPPAPTANKVWSEENVTSLDYVRIPYAIRSAVWSESRGLVYGLTFANSPTAPNSLVSINPLTLAVQVLPLGGESWILDMSANGEFIYIAMSGNDIRRVRTSDFTQDLALTIGGASTRVQRVVPSPVAPHTFAVLANAVNQDYDGYGLFIYDDAAVRPASVSGHLFVSPTEAHLFSFIDADWAADGASIYAIGNGSSSGMFDLGVDAQGAHFVRHRALPTASPGQIIGNRYFSTDGRVFNLTGAVNLEARISDYYFATPSRNPAPSRGKIFSLGTNLDGQFADGTRIIAFDFDTFAYLDAIVFNDAANFGGGSVVPWGTDGFFLPGGADSIIAQGTFAAAGGAPPASSATLPLRASGVTRNTAGDAVSFRVVDMSASAVTTNSCGRMFVATNNTSWVRPGSVMEVDPAGLTITRSANVGSEPFLLAASSDCSTLYTGLYSSSSVRRLRTSDLVTTEVLPLGDYQLSRARSISVAPGQAQTVAISLGDVDRTLCGGSDQGVMIYDGTVPRPLYDPDMLFGHAFALKSVAFGANASVLYGEDPYSVYAFNVDANGLSNPRPLMVNQRQLYAYDLGLDMFYDAAANRVYNLLGNVYDTTANAEMTKVPLVHNPASAGCGTPAQTATTDPTTGKLYWVGDGRQYYLGLSAYSRNGHARLGDVEFGLGEDFGYFGTPMHLSRLPGNQLALVTSYGYLILLQGALLAP